MRSTGKHLDAYRKVHPKNGPSDPRSLWGYFRFKIGTAVLAVLSSGERHSNDGVGAWEHVSVSVFPKAQRLPTWEEMQKIKDLFWGPDETVVEFHPPDSEHVNVYDCLHLWKPPYELPLPPTIALAYRKTGRVRHG